ncbi:MAG: DUF1311 domain-containing protein [Lachnospiraceae bacterium]|nr:DUF1311 domain-containing protein [Lachnospiraceae bacterium]
MKRNVIAVLLVINFMILACGCGGKGKGEDVPEESAFSFEDLAGIEFHFDSKGRTTVVIHADGSFQGEYSDVDTEGMGEDFQETEYRCDFSGQFTQPVKVNDYTYSVQIEEMNYKKEEGKEEIKEGVRYIYSDAYGLADTENILIYLSGAPLEELPEEYRSWTGYYDSATDEFLPCYGLYNKERRYGFSSYRVADNLRDMIASVEECTAPIEEALADNSMLLEKRCEKADMLCWWWDTASDYVWEALRKTQDEETLRTLTEEEKDWILIRERLAAEAGAAYENEAQQSLAMKLKTAELTRERVYELLEHFE